MAFVPRMLHVSEVRRGITEVDVAHAVPADTVGAQHDAAIVPVYMPLWAHVSNCGFISVEKLPELAKDRNRVVFHGSHFGL